MPTLRLLPLFASTRRCCPLLFPFHKTIFRECRLSSSVCVLGIQTAHRPEKMGRCGPTKSSVQSAPPWQSRSNCAPIATHLTFVNMSLRSSTARCNREKEWQRAFSGTIDIVAEEMVKPKVRRIMFVTGAGLSADSGLPTYRGISGLYNQGTTEDGIHIESAISGEMLRHHPEVCWKYLAQIEEACRGAEPNAGHVAIKRLEEAYEVWVLTQNVDGLHKKAGSKHVIDIHGEVHLVECTYCSHFERVTDYSHLPYSRAGEHPTLTPQCPKCSSLLRPGITLYGESLDLGKYRTLEMNLHTWGFDVVVAVGTSAEFPYIALPVHVANQNRKLTVEVNLGVHTPLSEMVSVRIPYGASEFLKALADRVLAQKQAKET